MLAIADGESIFQKMIPINFYLVIAASGEMEEGTSRVKWKVWTTLGAVVTAYLLPGKARQQPSNTRGVQPSRENQLLSAPPSLSLSLFSLINFNKWWTTPLNPRNTDGLPLHSNKRKILWNRPKHQTSFYPFFLHSFKISFKWVNTYKHVCVYIYIQIYLRSLFWISSWLILFSVSITNNWKEKVITTDSLVSECNKRKRRRDWWLLSITLIDVGEERKERKK